MALILADRVKESTTTTGTSDFALGGAITGFQTFSASVGANNTTYYSVADGADWEVGLGTLSNDGLTLARTTVLQSSNSDAKVLFAAGTKEVFVTYPADKAVFEDASGNVTVPAIFTATTKVVSPFFDAVGSAGGQLRNASGTSQLAWGAGGGNNLSLEVSTNLNGINAQIDISPTGTGHVHIKPTGSGSVEINPTNAGTMDNMAIGGTTPRAASFTTLTTTTPIAATSGGTGLTSLGAGVATFLGTPSSANLLAAVSDETGTGALVFATSPTLVTPALGTPSSAVLTNATGLPNAGLVNSSITIGGTAIALGASSNALANDITINGLTVGKGASSVANNTAFGGSALGAITSGDYNVAIGKAAADALTDGSVNVAVGSFALSTCSSGSRNTAFGHSALETTTGSGNTSIGYNSGKAITTGSYNTIVGYYNGLTTQSNMVVLADGQQSAVFQSAPGYSVALYGASIQAGTGITFPATQSASSDANTLDDYEEGVWVPNQGSGLLVVGTFSSSGTYTKIGRTVFVTGTLTGSTLVSTGTGDIMTSNLPFPSLNAGSYGLGNMTNNSLNVTSSTWVNSNSSTLYGTVSIAATTNVFFTAVYQTST